MVEKHRYKKHNGSEFRIRRRIPRLHRDTQVILKTLNTRFARDRTGSNELPSDPMRNVIRYRSEIISLLSIERRHIHMDPERIEDVKYAYIHAPIPSEPLTETHPRRLLPENSIFLLGYFYDDLRPRLQRLTLESIWDLANFPTERIDGDELRTRRPEVIHRFKLLHNLAKATVAAQAAEKNNYGN